MNSHNSQRDFRLWTAELKSPEIEYVAYRHKKFARSRKLSESIFLRLLPLNTALLTTILGLQIMTSVPDETETRIARTDSFIFSYNADGVSAIVPTPHEKDGTEFYTLTFTCNDAALSITRVNDDHTRTFGPSDLHNMQTFGIIKNNPCEDGLDDTDMTDLAYAAVKNGLTNFPVSPDAPKA